MENIQIDSIALQLNCDVSPSYSFNKMQKDWLSQRAIVVTLELTLLR